jgi:hypothetical protein
MKTNLFENESLLPLIKIAKECKDVHEFISKCCCEIYHITYDCFIKAGIDISWGGMGPGVPKAEWRENVLLPTLTNFYNHVKNQKS